jgi:TolB-like protein
MRLITLGVFSTIALIALAAASAQTTEPAGVSVTGSGAPNETTVLVLPIAAPPGGAYASLGRGIQQDMAADLTTMTHGRVIAPAAAPGAVDEQSALETGRRESARFVVWGAAQVSGDQLRVTGQVLDTSSGQPLAALKATAPLDNLFPLEDSLAAQAARALPPPVGIAQAPQTQPAPQAPVEPYAAQPLPQTGAEPYVSVSPGEAAAPYYSYTEELPPTYYTYNQYYAYPGYWAYPYWGLYGGIGFGYGGGFWPHHHGWYDHGWYGSRYHGWYRGGAYGRPFGAGVPRGGFRGAGGLHGAGGFHGAGGSHGGAGAGAHGR